MTWHDKRWLPCVINYMLSFSGLLTPFFTRTLVLWDNFFYIWLRLGSMSSSSAQKCVEAVVHFNFSALSKRVRTHDHLLVFYCAAHWISRGIASNRKRGCFGWIEFTKWLDWQEWVEVESKDHGTKMLLIKEMLPLSKIVITQSPFQDIHRNY